MLDVDCESAFVTYPMRVTQHRKKGEKRSHCSLLSAIAFPLISNTWNMTHIIAWNRSTFSLIFLFLIFHSISLVIFSLFFQQKKSSIPRTVTTYTAHPSIRIIIRWYVFNISSKFSWQKWPDENLLWFINVAGVNVPPLLCVCIIYADICNVE